MNIYKQAMMEQCMFVAAFFGKRHHLTSDALPCVTFCAWQALNTIHTPESDSES